MPPGVLVFSGSGLAQRRGILRDPRAGRGNSPQHRVPRRLRRGQQMRRRKWVRSDTSWPGQPSFQKEVSAER